jgi:hypothetical protein
MLDAVTEQEVEMESSDPASSLSWMRERFALDEQEFRQICALHEDYMRECPRMTAERDAVRERLRKVLAERQDFDEAARQTLRDYEKKYDACETAAIAHVMRAAAVMDAESRRAYLEAMLPRLFPDHHSMLHGTRLPEGKS